MSFIYLASPYTDPDPAVVNLRYQMTAEFTAMKLKDLHKIYSPIVHCHDLAHKHDMPKDFEFWKEYNLAMLQSASEVWVLALEGWEESKGVRAEINHALQIPLPITLKYHIEIPNDN